MNCTSVNGIELNFAKSLVKLKIPKIINKETKLSLNDG